SYAHQEMPFEKLIEMINPERSLSHSPVFQVLFNAQHTSPFLKKFAGLTVEPIDINRDSADYDLTLSIWEETEVTKLAWQYNIDLFEEETIRKMSGHFLTLLEGAIDNPNQSIQDLSLLTKEESVEILCEWNQTEKDYTKEIGFHELFESQAEENSTALAVKYKDLKLSYEQLNVRANQMAHYLRSIGVGTETMVGISIPPSLDMVVALMGILKAGGTYLPLDIHFPTERLKYMVEDSGCKMILTMSNLKNEFETFKVQKLLVDQLENIILQHPTTNPTPIVSSENLAYVIYTSGSTGKPKGVEITHGSVTNFLKSMAQRPGLTSQDILLAVTTLSFDISVLEVFLPLTVGATLVLIDHETSVDGTQLASILDSEKITIMQATPATWQVLVNAGWSGTKGLKVLCGGEALSSKLSEQILTRCGSLWNMYGPTETTIWSSVHEITQENPDIYIGKPIDNTQFYILNAQLRPVPVGVIGNLYIGGDGLARGYHNRPDITAERFISNPFDKKLGAQIYNTGDLARYRKNGIIEYVGRSDFQVKIHGFRIELGEIESALMKIPQIKQAIVMVREDTQEDKRIVGYYLTNSTKTNLDQSIRELLKEFLPEYMLPSALVKLDAFPLTPNGKINRKALPIPDYGQMRSQYVEPESEIEIILAGIWSALLKVNPVSAKDSFFELGGHSLLATQLISRIKDRFEVKLPIKAVFQYPTLSDMSMQIENIMLLEIEALEEDEINCLLTV
ncbi:MAG: amino acid adenylation domain-containing protein, partial [Oscillospiraceae bacterium]